MVDLMCDIVHGEDESCIFKIPPKSILEDKLDIMLIDDSKKDAALFEALLHAEAGNMEFSLSKWHNPPEAIRALEHELVSLPQIIVLDLSMPAVNGSMALRKLREISRIQHIPIVTHSSISDYSNKMMVKDMQADVFFAKPLDVKFFKSFIYATIIKV